MKCYACGKLGKYWHIRSYLRSDNLQVTFPAIALPLTEARSTLQERRATVAARPVTSRVTALKLRSMAMLQLPFPLPPTLLSQLLPRLL